MLLFTNYGNRITQCLLYYLFFLSWTRHTSGESSCQVAGVAPNDCTKYNPTERVFYCGGKDNKRIPMKYVNDEYCDCQETGADEPGTSACLNGHFYCANRGFRGKSIYASWVNDGICDCCDGSDEWTNIQMGKIKCPNRCAELAEEELKGIREQKKHFEKGLNAKENLIIQGNQKINEKKRQIDEINEKIRDLETRTEIAKTKKESLEEKERNYRDELRKKKEEEDAKKRAEQGDNTNNSEQSQSQEQQQQQQEQDTAQEGNSNDEEQQQQQQEQREEQRKEEEEQKEKDRKEFPYPEEYRYKPKDSSEEEKGAKGEKGEKGEKDDDYFPYPEEYRYHGDDDNKGEGEGDDGFDWSEFDDEEEIFPDNGDIQDDVPPDDDIPYDPLLDDMSNAARTAKDEWRTLDRELRDLKRDLEDNEQYTNMDFGQHNEYASLYDECFTKEIKKYTYEFCPFNSASQKEKHNSVRLGKYTKFEIRNDNDNNSKTIMYFDKGQSCWQGPARSLKVIFECNDESTIESVSEPSTCTYEMIFKTPLACSQSDIQRLDHIINHQFKQEL